ncbi:DUF2637 domain-containing protein [Streptomyces sp. LX-29]|uniref:DUF2637 domain-containing protein n=1 Tax=Streptomyces sp. LX-29 TaxID=2900152 RepID=UPI00240DFF9B|nr:DUF2637 domain-containing protein [Streptomyces sp. LX-29]
MTYPDPETAGQTAGYSPGHYPGHHTGHTTHSGYAAGHQAGYGGYSMGSVDPSIGAFDASVGAFVDPSVGAFDTSVGAFDTSSVGAWDEPLDTTLSGSYPGYTGPLPAAETFDDRWDLDGDLARLLQSASAEESPQPPVDPTPAPAPAPAPPTPTAFVRGRGRRRRVRFRRPNMPWLRLFSLVFAALTTVIVAMLSVLSGMISYGPLRFVASPSTSRELVDWWPVLVYGPWLVASLSVLRAALHRRRPGSSWAVVVLFSAIAVFLCIAHAPRTVPGIAVAALPAVAALLSFHQLVRQITLTSPPRHALPRQRGPESHSSGQHAATSRG